MDTRYWAKQSAHVERADVGNFVRLSIIWEIKFVLLASNVIVVKTFQISSRSENYNFSYLVHLHTCYRVGSFWQLGINCVPKSIFGIRTQFLC